MIHEPYPDKELPVFKCKDCGRVFHEGEVREKMTNEEKKHAFLLEEYKQVYEQFRHCDNISQSKEAIFAVAAFGVMALLINKNLSQGMIIGAAVVSISLYLFHVIASERMHFITEVAIERLKEIETEINGEMGLDNIRFQTKIKDYKHKAKDARHKEWIGVRTMRWILVFLLIFLWGIVIGISIDDISHSRSKHWPRHNQTRHQRPHR